MEPGNKCTPSQLVMVLKGDYVFSKSLWKTISGTNMRVSTDIVSHQLKKARAQLLYGINYFKEPNPQNDETLKKEVSEKCYKFLMKLKNLLGIDVIQCWDLLCYYLLYEFRGSEVGLQGFLTSESKTSLLLADLWLFYQSERIFLLQCINVIMMFQDDKNHPYKDEYKKFIESCPQNLLLESLISQVSSLTQQPLPTSLTEGEFKTFKNQRMWAQSNQQEQISLLHSLLLCLGDEASPSNFWQMLQAFLAHKFGFDQPYRLEIPGEYEDVSQKIAYLEVIIIIKSLRLDSINVVWKLWTDVNMFYKVDDLMETLGTQGEHGPVLLAWMLFNYLSPGGEDIFVRYCRFGEMAARLDVATYLQRLLSHPMFEVPTKCTEIAHQVVYDLLDLLYSNFDKEMLHQLSGVNELAAAVLKHPKTAEIYWNTEKDTGLRMLFSQLAEFFPMEFSSFTKIVTSLVLASPQKLDEMISDLEKLEIFAEEFQYRQFSGHVTEIQHGMYTSNRTRTMLPYATLEIPAGTSGYITERHPPVFHWLHKYSYFTVVLNELEQLLAELSGSSSMSDSKVTKAVLLVNLLATVVDIKRFVPACISAPLETVFKLIYKLCEVANPPSKLLAACLNVVVNLLMVYPADISSRIGKFNFLPEMAIMNFDPTQCIKAEFLHHHVIGEVIVTQECAAGTYPLLCSYLSFMKRIMRVYMTTDAAVEHEGITQLERILATNVNYFFPGLVFIISEVFPSLHIWLFSSERERVLIANSCLEIFHRILNMRFSKNKRSGKSEEVAQLMYRTCLYNLLYTEAGIGLLKIVGTGDKTLQAEMGREMYWTIGPGVELMHVIQLALSVLNIVLQLKPEITKNQNTISPMEMQIYNQPDLKQGLKVVPMVSSYIYHTFNPNLPTLAVKLLKRFAVEYPISLLVCLGMDGDVVRHTFLFRLNSEIETVNFKVAVLELVAACIGYQAAITEAFFNLPAKDDSQKIFSKPYKKDDTPGGCLTYVCSLIKKSKQEPDFVTTPLYSAVLKLIHALWEERLQQPLTFLTSREDFWDDLCAGLFIQPEFDVKGYAYIFKIMSKELYCSNGMLPSKLEANIKKFFSESSNHLKIWSKFVKESLAQKVNEDRDPDLILLSSWKQFLIVAIKDSPCGFSSEQKKCIADDMMEALLFEYEDASSPLSLYFLLELNVHLLTKWKMECVKDPQRCVRQAQQLLHHTSIVYESLHSHVKEAALALIILLISLVGKKIAEDDMMSENMLLSCCSIVATELTSLPRPKEQLPEFSKSHKKCTDELDKTKQPTDVRELIDCLQFKPKKELQEFFSRRDTSLMEKSPSSPRERDSILENKPKAIEKDSKMDTEEKSDKPRRSCALSLCLLSKLLRTLPNSDTLKRTVQNSNIIPQLLVVTGRALQDLDHFTFSVNAMNLIVTLAETGFENMLMLHNIHICLWMQLIPPKELANTDGLWTHSKWQDVYRPAVHLLSHMVRSQKHGFLEQAITFAAMHEEYIKSILLLMEHSVKMKDLEFVLIILTFLQELAEFKLNWRLSHEKSMFFILKSVMTCLDRSVSLLLNSRMLRLLVEHPKLVSKVNKKKPENEPASEHEQTDAVVAVQNRILDIIVMCMAFLNFFTPSVIYLLTEFRECNVYWEPLVEINFHMPTLVRAPPTLTFSTLISITNICIQAITKANRTPSPGRTFSYSLSTSSVTTPGLNSSWLSTLDKNRVSVALEMSLSLITAQGVLLLMDHRISDRDKQLIRRELSSEMTLFLEYARRTFRGWVDTANRFRKYAFYHSFTTSGVKRSMPSSHGEDKRPHAARRLLLTTSEQLPHKSSLLKTPKMGPAHHVTWSPSIANSGKDKDKAPDKRVSTPSDATSKEAPASAPSVPRQPSDQDYVRLMAHIFNCVFR